MVKALDQHIQKQFGIKFNKKSLLLEAFTHSSYANDHRNQNQLVKNLERLEFLGDAVLELAVSQYLFKKYPDTPEGELTRMRAATVREESIASMAKECQFGDFIRLGKGEEQTQGRQRPSLLGDVFEAFLGALFLDQGQEGVTYFLKQVLFPRIDADDFSHGMDYKTSLQELMQKNGGVAIHYQVIDSYGPDHDRQFVVEVSIEGDVYGQGKGRSKKIAQQQAAKVALEQIQKEE